MTTDVPTRTPTPTLRRPALIAGLSLLVLAVVAGWANLGVVERLVAEGDAARTTRDLLESRETFRLAIAGLFLSAALDVVIAWALAVFLMPADQRLARLAGWSRAAYAVCFTVAIWQLVAADRLLSRSAADGEVLAAMERYDTLWNSSLALFGIHLILAGWAALRSDYVPRPVGVLVLVCGAGYLADGIGTAFFSGSFEISTVTFVGEVVLMVWLLWYAVRTRPTPALPGPAARPPRAP